jgi:hypothetical protein
MKKPMVQVTEWLPGVKQLGGGQRFYLDGDLSLFTNGLEVLGVPFHVKPRDFQLKNKGNIRQHCVMARKRDLIQAGLRIDASQSKKQRRQGSQKVNTTNDFPCRVASK